MYKKYQRYFKILFFISIIIAQIIIPVWVYAETPSKDDTGKEMYGTGVSADILDQQIKSGEIKKIQGELNKYSSEGLKEISPGFDPEKIISDAAKGEFKLNISEMANNGLKYLLKEIYMNIDILIKLIVLVIMCAILKNLQTSFLSDSVGEVAFYACYIVLVSIMIISLNTALGLGREIIDKMVNFMQASIPVLLTLLVSGGNFTSAGIFQPMLILIVQVSASIIKNIFIPLIFLSAVLSIVDNISEKIQISRLAQFLRQVSGWTLGLILTVFIAIISVQGSVGAVIDGVTSKTAKFAIGAMIPVAGKYLADAADTVIGCTLLIKNAAGIAVMLGVIGICIIPLLKIFTLLLIYRITCILIEPIAEKRITNCINEMANSLTFVFGLAASVAFMFLISVTIIIGASNISTMVR